MSNARSAEIHQTESHTPTNAEQNRKNSQVVDAWTGLYCHQALAHVEAITQLTSVNGMWPHQRSNHPRRFHKATPLAPPRSAYFSFFLRVLAAVRGLERTIFTSPRSGSPILSFHKTRTTNTAWFSQDLSRGCFIQIYIYINRKSQLPLSQSHRASPARYANSAAMVRIGASLPLGDKIVKN